MARCVVKHQWRKTMKDATVYTKYIGFRSRERADEEKGFFDRKHDLGADYEKFLERIKDNPALKYGKTTKMHALILSFRPDDFAAVKEGGGAKDMVRDFMKELEERKGMKLDWVAAVHETATHPHVHIHISGVGQTPDKKSKRIKLDVTDYKWARETLDRTMERHNPRERKEYKPRDRTPELTGRAANKLFQGIQNEATQDLATKPMKGNRKRRARRDQQQKQVDREVTRTTEMDR